MERFAVSAIVSAKAYRIIIQATADVNYTGSGIVHVVLKPAGGVQLQNWASCSPPRGERLQAESACRRA